MGILNLILLTLALVLCNLGYCGQRIVADWRHARRAEVAWGALALCGALTAVATMVWATAASLANIRNS